MTDAAATIGLCWAEIIAVGSELLVPPRLDTNSLFITGCLNELGIEVRCAEENVLRETGHARSTTLPATCPSRHSTPSRRQSGRTSLRIMRHPLRRA